VKPSQACQVPHLIVVSHSLLPRSVLIHDLEDLPDGEPGTPRSPGGRHAAEKVKELSMSLDGSAAESKRTLDKFKSLGNRSLSRGLNNVRRSGLQLCSSASAVPKLDICLLKTVGKTHGHACSSAAYCPCMELDMRPPSYTAHMPEMWTCAASPAAA
jgi:hypothetical protein